MTWTVPEASRLLTDQYVGETLYVAMMDFDLAVTGNFTVDTNTSVITSAVNINFVEGTRVTFLAEGGGTLPSGLNDINTYFVTNVNGNTFQVKVALTDANPVNINDTGTGTYTFSDSPPLPSDNLGLAAYTRYELSSGSYPSNLRLTWTPSSLVLSGNPTNEVQLTGSVTLAGNMDTNGAIVIYGGSNAPGNTTGTVIYKSGFTRTTATNANPKTLNLKIAVPIPAN